MKTEVVHEKQQQQQQQQDQVNRKWLQQQQQQIEKVTKIREGTKIKPNKQINK